ncbi:ankyrin repeat-containing domain, PGG domain protein, partial [Tanacetum coccineum]
IPVSTQLVELKNSDGSTLLHVAAIVGNTRAVNILVSRARALLIMKDNKDQTLFKICYGGKKFPPILLHRMRIHDSCAGVFGCSVSAENMELGTYELAETYCHPDG